MNKSKPYYLYRLVDRDGLLLYIGCSSSPWKRLGCHFRAVKGSPFREEMAPLIANAWVSDPYPNWDAAHAAEINAIENERPRFNVEHNHQQRPRRKRAAA